jgi:2-C-methyl-D-erythritol 4-phosphate cytidylyltransferase
MGGRRKPSILIGGVPMLHRALCRLCAARGCAEVVLAVHPDDLSAYDARRLGEMRERFRVAAVVPGGRTRQESVWAALQATSESLPLVLIHDAARPLVQPGLVERVAVRAAETGAAIAAVRSVATVKQVDEAGHIVATPPRHSLWLAQTPQGFRRAIIIEAHRRAVADGFVGTDDAQLVERMGLPVVVVEDSPENLKVTTPEDLVLAEAILARQRAAGAVDG